MFSFHHLALVEKIFTVWKIKFETIRNNDTEMRNSISMRYPSFNLMYILKIIWLQLNGQKNLYQELVTTATTNTITGSNSSSNRWVDGWMKKKVPQPHQSWKSGQINTLVFKWTLFVQWKICSFFVFNLMGFDCVGCFAS